MSNYVSCCVTLFCLLQQRWNFRHFYLRILWILVQKFERNWLWFIRKRKKYDILWRTKNYYRRNCILTFKAPYIHYKSAACMELFELSQRSGDMSFVLCWTSWLSPELVMHRPLAPCLGTRHSKMRGCQSAWQRRKSSRSESPSAVDGRD